MPIACATIKLSDGATAVDMVNASPYGDVILAVGTESGSMDLYGISRRAGQIETKHLIKLDSR